MPRKATAPAASPEVSELDLRLVPVADLKPDPGNARRHGERNLTEIEHSLTRFGQRKPLVVTGDLQVIAGNGTLTVLQRLGWERAWVSVYPGTAAEARAYGIADNRTGELAAWDAEALTDALLSLHQLDASLLTGAGFNMDELDELTATADTARDLLADTGAGEASVTAGAGARFTPAATGDPEPPETRTLACDLPPYLFTWASTVIAEYREGHGLGSSSDALIGILEEVSGTPAPAGPEEPR